jgi:hypothetical protein
MHTWSKNMQDIQNNLLILSFLTYKNSVSIHLCWFWKSISMCDKFYGIVLQTGTFCIFYLCRVGYFVFIFYYSSLYNLLLNHSGNCAYCHVFGVPWLITVDSRFDHWIYWIFQLQLHWISNSDTKLSRVRITWLMIVDSRFDHLVYLISLSQLHSISTVHTLNSFLRTNPSLFSLFPLSGWFLKFCFSVLYSTVGFCIHSPWL